MNYAFSKVYFSILPFLCFLITSCSNAQKNEPKTVEFVSQKTNPFNDLIPTNKKVYMIGEVHLDQDAPTPEGIEYIIKTTRIEDSIRQYLVEQCGVNHFLLEIPSSHQYFYNMYLETGDESWIHDQTTQKYLYDRLRNLRKLKEINPEIKISCVDIDYPKYTNKVAFALITLTFYDHYSKLYYPPYYTVEAIPVSADLNIAISILKTDTIKITNITRPFFKSLIVLVVGGNDAAPQLYSTLVNTLKDKKLLEALRVYYGKDYDPIVNMMTNYIYGYNKDFLSQEMLDDREHVLFEAINTTIKKYPKDIFCYQGGDIHTSASPEKNMVRQRLISGSGIEPFCMHLYPKNFATIIEKLYKLPAPLSYDFEGEYSIKKMDGGDLGVKVK